MIPTTIAQSILEHLTTAVLWFDSDLFLQALNPAAENLLEMSAKHATGLKIEAVLPDDTLCHKTLPWVLTRHYPMIERNLALRLSNVRTITVDCTITPVSDNQQIQHILVELKQIDQQLRMTREENLLLQQQTVRNMIRGLAHEIKNPLGGLRGAAQLLERELPSDQLREYTHIIIGEADRLQTLVNRMLVPTGLAHKQWINIHQVLMRVQQLLLSENHEGLHIECDFDPSIPELFADADQLLQAVLNIMRNAMQALENTGTITVRTRVCRQKTLGNKHHKLVIRLDIIDNGPGIPPQMIDQIFYPLVTGRVGGTGLGLSIAQTLVNQQGGLVECSSRPGKTVLTLWLPVENDG